MLSKLPRRLAVGALVLFWTVTCAASDALFTHVGKVVAIGDLHGDYEQYVRILKFNGLVDRKLKWAGGDIHLVQLGDVTDRGPDSLKIIRHLQKLQKQARKDGGQVHVLIGNHEAMNIQTDLRYVHPGEYAALVTRKSKKSQERYIEAVFQSMLAADPTVKEREAETRARLESWFPLGYYEHRLLWEPGQELANWYAANPVVIQINDTIYLHGGLDPHVESYKDLDQINAENQADLKPGATPAVSVDPRGPLWYRGLATAPAEEELEPLQRMLDHYGAKRIVIAHTPTRGAVMPRFDGRVVLADVGISAHYGGSLANVVIDGERVSAMHRGELLALPGDDAVGEYLKRAADLEPEGSRLAKYVARRLASPEKIEAPAD